MHAAFEAGEIVGGAGAFTFDLSVPGGSLPCAGVTIVGTYPTHRRRGVLRAMMRAQLDDVHARGEPIASLWASEETIYGRFGYGIASWDGEVSIPREANAFAAPLERRGQVRFVSAEEAVELFAPVWAAFACSVRACSPDRRRGGRRGGCASPTRRRRIRGGSSRSSWTAPMQAYAIYRTKPGFEDGAFDGQAGGARGDRHDPAGDGGDLALPARRRLDRDGERGRCCRPTIRSSCCWRRRAVFATGWATRSGSGSSTSAPRSRAARTAGDGSVVFEVRDEFCPWNEGRWRRRRRRRGADGRAGGARARRERARLRRISAPCRSGSCATRSGSRSWPRARSSGPTRCSRGARSPGAPRSSDPAVPGRYTSRARGRLAQLGEHQLDKLGVTGSSPVPPTLH